MSALDSKGPAFVESVLHPSDFSENSRNAFAHALAVALRRRTCLTLLHVAGHDEAADVWDRFPAVRDTLERWGLLEPGSPRTAVLQELGVAVSKINVRGGDVLETVLGFLEENETDVIVLGTEGREGPPRWFRPSVAEGIARESKTMTLFVPSGTNGFVSADTGEVTLRRILVPIDRDPSPVAALTYASRAPVLTGGNPVELTLLHIGNEASAPAIDVPRADGCTWKTVYREGAVVEQILAASRDESADLIVMPTKGRDGILDALRGSVTEQVVRQAECPVLAVPASDES